MTDSRPPAVTPAFDAAAASAAYRNALQVIAAVEPRVADAIGSELADQRASLKLIASENYASPAVLLTMGNWLSATSTPRARSGTASTPAARTSTPSSRSPPSTPASCSAPRTPTSSRTRASTPTWSRSGRCWPSGSSARARRGRRQARQRPLRRRLGDAAARARRPADARHVAGRRRAPDARLPAQHQRQDVRASPPTAPIRRPGCSTTPRSAAQAREFRPLILIAGYSRLSAQDRLRHDARDRRRGGRHADRRHGALRRPGRRQGVHRRLRPGAARARRHEHHPQVAARPARRVGAVPARVRRRGRPRLPDGARRPAAARHGGQGGRLRRGPAAHLRRLRAGGGRQRRRPGRGADARAASAWSPAAPTTTSCCSTSARSGSPGGRPSPRCSTPASSPTATPIPADPNGAWYTSGVRIGHAGADHPRVRRRPSSTRTAELIADVLAGTTPTTTSAGAPSKAKYAMADGLADRTRAAAAELLAAHPLYPGLDLA